jgi:hypothetical protein
VPTLEWGGKQGGGQCHNSVKTSIFKNSVSFLSSRRVTFSLQNDTITYVCQSLPRTLNKSNQISIVLKARDGIHMFHSICIVVHRASCGV